MKNGWSTSVQPPAIGFYPASDSPDQKSYQPSWLKQRNKQKALRPSKGTKQDFLALPAMLLFCTSVPA